MSNRFYAWLWGCLKFWAVVLIVLGAAGVVLAPVATVRPEQRSSPAAKTAPAKSEPATTPEAAPVDEVTTTPSADADTGLNPWAIAIIVVVVLLVPVAWLTTWLVKPDGVNERRKAKELEIVELRALRERTEEAERERQETARMAELNARIAAKRKAEQANVARTTIDHGDDHSQNGNGPHSG